MGFFSLILPDSILRESANFTLLKKHITITILLFGLTFTSFAQNKPAINADVQTKLVKFYPNPATSNINFELQRPLDKSYSLQVFNFMGKKVLELTPASQRMNLSLAGLYRGVYIYQLRDKSGKILDSGRFQVIR